MFSNQTDIHRCCVSRERFVPRLVYFRPLITSRRLLRYEAEKFHKMNILEFVNEFTPLETTEESDRRKAITTTLECIANEWLAKCESANVATKLLTFGSSILGVVTTESDLDTVLLIPSSISRDRFFSGFVGFLTANPRDLVITSLMSVPDAHVPVLKMVVNGLPVDILPCRVPPRNLTDFLGSVSEIQETGDFKLISSKDLCTPSLLALNGVRVGRTLVDSIIAGRVVLDDERIELDVNAISRVTRLTKFRTVLRLVKLWAKERGVYSNIMGYFGGVTWAILLVKVCLSPITVGESRSLVIDSLDDHGIAARFFKFCHEWTWGTAKPITLKPLPNGLAQFLSTISKPSSAQSTPSMSAIPSPRDDEIPGIVSEESPAKSLATNSSMWDPSTNEADRKCLMPVLTPISPFMNSTFNVLVSTQRVLLDEFRRAVDITSSPDFDPSILCKSALPELLTNYGLLLPLKLSIRESYNHLPEPELVRILFVWKSLIESKLRVLIFHLERVPGIICRPFPSPQTIDKLTIQFSVALSLTPSEEAMDENSGKLVYDLNYAVSQFHGALATTLESRPDKKLLKQYCRLEIAI